VAREQQNKKYLHGEGVCPIGHTWDGTSCVPVYQEGQACTKEVTQCWYPADWHECGHHYYSPHEGEWVNECEDCTLTLNGQKPYHDMNHTDCCVQTVQYLDFWPFTTDGFTGDACNHNGSYNEDPCRPQNGGSGGFCWMATGCCYYEGGELAGGIGENTDQIRGVGFSKPADPSTGNVVIRANDQDGKKINGSNNMRRINRGNRTRSRTRTRPRPLGRRSSHNNHQSIKPGSPVSHVCTAQNQCDCPQPQPNSCYSGTISIDSAGGIAFAQCNTNNGYDFQVNPANWMSDTNQSSLTHGAPCAVRFGSAVQNSLMCWGSQWWIMDVMDYPEQVHYSTGC